jgi:hypothetical protein
MISRFTLTSRARTIVGVVGIVAPPRGEASADVLSFEWFTGYDCPLEVLYIVWKIKGINNLVYRGKRA